MSAIETKTDNGVQDFFRHAVVAYAGVPQWWPAFCGDYDFAAADRTNVTK